MNKRLLLRPLFALVDICILGGAFLLAYWLRFDLTFLPEKPIPAFELYFRFSFLVGIIGFAMLYSSGMYRLRQLSFGIEDFFSLFKAVTFSAMIIMAMNFILRGYITGYDVETYSRLIIVIAWLLSLLLLTCWRMSTALLFKVLRRQGKGLKNVIIVGTDDIARGFCRAIKGNVDIEYRPIGFIYNGTMPEHNQFEGFPVLGGVDDLPKVIRGHIVNEVILTSMEMDNEKVAQLVKICERFDIQFSMIPGFFEILTRQMTVQEVADVPIFQLEERIFQRWGRLVKRGIDVVFSSIIILLCGPFWLLVAIAIRIESQGPIFFKHERVGKGEKVFAMFKFRSMYDDAEARRRELEELYKSDDALLRVVEDKRVTVFGRFLRRYSIDELPQLINVIRGEMSLVGPRPHMPSEVARYKEWHRRKFDVLPGMTGLTQVSGRKDLSLDEMVRRDIYYIENWSPLLDLQILLRTIPAVLTGKGAY